MDSFFVSSIESQNVNSTKLLVPLILVIIHGQQFLYIVHMLYTLTVSMYPNTIMFVCVLVYVHPHICCFANRDKIYFCLLQCKQGVCVFLSTVSVCKCTNLVLCVLVCVNKDVIKPKSSTLQWGGFSGNSSPQRCRLHLLLQSFLI